MNSKKVSYILCGVFAVLCLAILGGAFEANKLLQSRSAKLVSLKLQSSVLDQKQLQLFQNKKDIKTYSSLNVIAKTIVPQDKDQAQAAQQIADLASASGIKQLSSISFPASSLGGTAATGTATAGSSSSKNKLTQLTKVTGISGVYDLQITVQQNPDSKVSYNTFLTFLAKLQQNRRTAQVSSVDVQPDTADPSMVSFTLTIDEFIKP